MVTMQQHVLFDEEDFIDWRIDEHTKAIGRMGIAAARATLESCKARAEHDSFAHAA